MKPAFRNENRKTRKKNAGAQEPKGPGMGKPQKSEDGIQKEAGTPASFLTDGQQPQPHPFPEPPRKFPPHPPQQSRRSRIRQQLSFPPHPFPENMFPPPQQERRRISQIREVPFVFSHPHPQLVAAKSLIFWPPKIFYTVSYAKRIER